MDYNEVGDYGDGGGGNVENDDDDEDQLLAPMEK